MTFLIEYRCTREVAYLHECLGRDNIEVRQGHYIHAHTPEEARREMAEAWPQDLPRAVEAGVVPFTVEDKGVSPFEGDEEEQGRDAVALVAQLEGAQRDLVRAVLYWGEAKIPLSDLAGPIHGYRHAHERLRKAFPASAGKYACIEVIPSTEEES